MRGCIADQFSPTPFRRGVVMPCRARRRRRYLRMASPDDVDVVGLPRAALPRAKHATFSAEVAASPATLMLVNGCRATPRAGRWRAAGTPVPG